MSIAPSNHTRGALTSDSWITPRWILDAFGPFDLDPCACDPQPWPTATRMITAAENGLLQKWTGVVWCNPPYGKEMSVWLERMAAHNNGIALVFARTETKAFHAHVWPRATSLLFLNGRLKFHYPDGTTNGSANAGGPSVLIAYGHEAHKRLFYGQKYGAFAAGPFTPSA